MIPARHFFCHPIRLNIFIHILLLLKGWIQLKILVFLLVKPDLPPPGNALVVPLVVPAGQFVLPDNLVENIYSYFIIALRYYRTPRYFQRIVELPIF